MKWFHFKIRLGIRPKLAGTYLLIIVGVLLGINWLVLGALEADYLRDREVKSLTNANIIALAGQDVILRQDRNTYYFARNYGEQVRSRVIILDGSGKVTVDSFGESWLEGQSLSHAEVVSALAGTGRAGVYTLQSSGEKVLYAAVPVGDQKPASGAVMLVTGLSDVYIALGEIRRLMMLVSTGGGLIAVAVGLFLAARFTRPIQNLTGAVQAMAQGQLGQRVKIDSSDELGRLAESFNEMAGKLEKEDRIRRQFLTDSSHELKTPLSSIKVLAQSLLDGKEQDIEVYRDFLQDVNTEADRMSRLVNDMFQLAKLEDAEYPVQFSAQELEPVLDHVQGLLRGQADLKGIIMEIRPAQGAGGRTAVADVISWPLNRDLFTRVLINLLDNALRYTSTGGKVLVSYQVERDELVLRVSDTGRGIPQEYLPHIFERFFRVDQARARETGGTGLGLAIARQAVLRHGGTITVDSRQGVGTTFELRFPGTPVRVHS